VTPRVRELRIVYSGTTAGPLPKVGRPSEVAALLRSRVEKEPVEIVLVLLVDTKHRVIGLHEVGRGTLDACLVHPRDVFKAALLANASGVIVAHNHPSGDPTPSPEDLALCTRLRSAAAVIGIDLLDFLILGQRLYYSFQEAQR